MPASPHHPRRTSPGLPRGLRTIALLLVFLSIAAWGASTVPAAPAAPPSLAERLVGDWWGVLEAGPQRLRTVLHVARRNDGSLEASFQSPDQTPASFPARVTIASDRVTFLVQAVGGSYEAGLAEDGTLQGTWQQRGFSLPLCMRRGTPTMATEPPDTPRPPFPYRTEDVSYFSTESGVTLAGTLCIPPGRGPFPAVLLIAGSGPMNRDERIGPHRPFFLLADALARSGFVVLRSDKRGVGASTGNAETADLDAYARDAAGGVDFLKSRKEVDAHRIGLLGHSEGGLVAPLVAATLRPRIVAWMVLLSAPAVPGRDLLLEQARLVLAGEAASEEQTRIARAANEKLYDAVVTEKDPHKLKTRLREILESVMGPVNVPDRKAAAARHAAIENQVRTLMSPWFRQFLSYDPITALVKLRCPVLALYGDLDVQVPSAQNLAPMQSALKEAKTPEGTVHLLPGHNHLFQRAGTGLPKEYDTIPETMSPVTVTQICAWAARITSATPRKP